MIVAIHTVHKTAIRTSALDQRQSSDVTMGQLPGDNLPEVGLTVLTESNDSTFVPVASDELIIAVQYRKVQFKWFSSRKIDSAFLEMGCNRWKVFLISARADLDDGEDDVVEADLQEDIGEEDVEEEGDIYINTGGDMVIV
jgi:hypothetical protein